MSVPVSRMCSPRGVRVTDVLETERLLLSDLESLGIEGLVDRQLRELQREARLVRDTTSHRKREVAQFVARHHVVDHAKAVGFFGVDRVAREQQLLGLANTQLPRMAEPLDTVDTVADGQVLEARVIGRDDEVTHPHQHQTTGDDLALHDGNGGLRDVVPAPAHVEVHLLLVGHESLRAAPARRSSDPDRVGVVDSGTFQVVAR